MKKNHRSGYPQVMVDAVEAYGFVVARSDYDGDWFAWFDEYHKPNTLGIDISLMDIDEAYQLVVEEERKRIVAL